MSTAAKIGYKSFLKYATTQNGSYSALSEVVDITTPSQKVGKVEATHMQSANNLAEYIDGQIIELGDCGLKLNYLPAQTTTINAAIAARTALWFHLILPDGSYWEWHGNYGEFGQPVPLKDVVQQDITVNVLDSLTYVGGS